MFRPLQFVAGLVLATLALCATAPAATYYVSQTDGADTNTGLDPLPGANGPWKSLAKASGVVLQPGDVVLFKRGDVWVGDGTSAAATLTITDDGTAAQPIIIDSYGAAAAKPLLDGQRLFAGPNLNLSGATWVVIKNLALKNSGPSNPGVRIDNSCHDLTLLGVDVTDSSGIGMVAKNSWNLLFDGCTVTNGGNGGIQCTGSKPSEGGIPVHDVTIQNCTVNGTGSNDGICLHEGPDYDGTAVLGSNFIIRNNTSNNCEEQGFDMTAGSNILLEYNTSTGNNNGSLSVGHSARDITIRYHTSVNDRQSNSIKGQNIVLEYSTFVSSSTDNKALISTRGVPKNFPEDLPSENIIIRNNVFVWNNAVAGPLFAVFSAEEALYFELTSLHHLTIQNNIFTSLPGKAAPTILWNGPVTPAYDANFVFSNNVYYSPSGPVTFTAGGQNYPSLAAYQAAFSIEQNSTTADPLLVNPVARDFHLASTASSAFDAGVDAGIAADFDGVAVPQGAHRDIGAFEFPVTIAAPTGLTATAVAPHEIQLAWTDTTTDETAFRIQRKVGAGGAYADTTPATVAANIVTFSDTGVADNTTYFYQVRSENPLGASAWSDEASATTPEADTTAPVIGSLTATPDHLWPANHKMVAVTLTAPATDDRDPAPVTKILSVTSSEAANGSGDGNTAIDWAITGDLTLNLRAERSGNGPGRLYTVTVQSTDASGNSSTAAVLIPVGHNNDTQPPTVALTAPANGALVGGAIALTATASDNDSVVGVQFKLDGANLGVEDSSAPYVLSWNTTTVANGNHTLTAVARDENGNMATSAPVTVFVDNAAPDVAVTAPAANSLLTGSGITLTASATDNVAVAAVQFKVDGAAVGAELTAAPYEFTWDSSTVTDGNHTLTATARDTIGNTATSAAVVVTTDNLAPTVALTAPAANAIVGGAAVTLTATASDLVGVAGVQFQVDGVDVGAEDTTAPYSVTWDSTATVSGGHTLTAVARDGVGHTAVSAPVTVTVDNLAPTVAVTAPAAGSTVSGSTVAVSATATDNLAVVGVQFKLDGVNLGTEDTTAPYGVNWNSTTAANGAHTLTAVARDATGNTALSAPVSVNVSNVALPVTHQVESLTRTASAGDTTASFAPAGVSGQAIRLNANAVGDWVEFTVNVSAASAGNNNVTVRFHRNAFRAISALLIDGVPLGAPYDAYAAAAGFISVDLGSLNLSAGNHAFRFQITGRNPLANPTDYQVGVDFITLTPQ